MDTGKEVLNGFIDLANLVLKNTVYANSELPGQIPRFEGTSISAKVTGTLISLVLPPGGGEESWLAREAAGIERAATATAVIGHYPAYIELADKLGARAFTVPPEIWAKMTFAEQWAANQKFLDRAIAAGATFVLATAKNDIRSGSWLAREVEYLLQHGYEWNADATRLIPKKH